jgi:hypothetical protein
VVPPVVQLSLVVQFVDHGLSSFLMCPKHSSVNYGPYYEGILWTKLLQVVEY